MDDTHAHRAHPFAVRIIESPLLTMSAVDWSDCRSPSRAARRSRLGHRQNIRHFTAPHPGLVSMGGKLYMHPETAAKLRACTREVEERIKECLFDIAGRRSLAVFPPHADLDRGPHSNERSTP